MHQQLYLLLPAAEHAEALLRVGRHVQPPEALPPLSLLVGHADAQHLVYPVVLDHVRFRVISYQVVVLIVPGKSPGAYLINGAAVAQLHLLFCIPLKILEEDLPVAGNGAVDSVHRVVDALVHGLDAAGHVDLALQLPGLVLADQALQLPYELVGFLCRDEPGGLDGVHQQLQLRHLELPAHHVVAVGSAPGLPLHLDPQMLQVLQVRVDALPVRRHLIGAQRFQDLRHGQVVIIVRLLQHDLRKIVKFQFLVLSSGHMKRLPSCLFFKYNTQEEAPSTYIIFLPVSSERRLLSIRSGHCQPASSPPASRPGLRQGRYMPRRPPLAQAAPPQERQKTPGGWRWS